MSDTTPAVNPPPNPDWDGITRVEVFDCTGRAYVRWNVEAHFDIQDDGRTLKVFVAEPF